MPRFLLIALMVCLGAKPAFALSEIDGLVNYTCQSGVCTAQCIGPGVSFQIQYSELSVFQFKDHPGRLWISGGSPQYVLGGDVTCSFEGTPSFKPMVSPLGPPPTPPKICIGNVCN